MLRYYLISLLRQHIMKKIKGIIALSRIFEVFDFTLALSLLGIILSGGWIGTRMIAIIFANFLAMTYAFMINDVEDAPEDAENPKKKKRNPICNGSLTRGEGLLVSNITLLLSFLLYLLIAVKTGLTLVLVIGILTLLVSFLYSWRKVRLKAIPIVDVITHMFMLSGFIYLTSYYSYSANMTTLPLIAFMSIISISAYGQLDNEVRDFETDKKTSIKTLATIIGKKPAQILQFLFMATAVILFIYIVLALKDPVGLVIKFLISFTLAFIVPFILYLKKDKRIEIKPWIQRSLVYAAILTLVWTFLTDRFIY